MARPSGISLTCSHSVDRTRFGRGAIHVEERSHEVALSFHCDARFQDLSARTIPRSSLRYRQYVLGDRPIDAPAAHLVEGVRAQGPALRCSLFSVIVRT